ncbi:trans-aconitate 2-methyltransferase [Kribbella sp. VKM Ac-2527]|uniref:Trans-aconitate 2-methyltransferase n=1 Tax=Kribbella caucasensis TaxID=2512215 RepID=A0A4R6K856_9ACTN|nr:methyltransferase domain-containing protein [Kribbella sp. VKM Ac-2527]TDO45863.1 trans-aconitate 2-methyltransferase [Kribbella sp. VKM Ac-2527]
MRTSPVWSPEQYGTYADERGRAFADLIGRIKAEDATTVVDLGCGPGNLTLTLLDRWPSATIRGVDSSPQMLAAAQKLTADLPAEAPDDARGEAPGGVSGGMPGGVSGGRGRLRFELGDLRDWSAEPESIDIIVTNATLQWIPEQLDLLPGFVRALKPGGWLAIQIPGNGDAPSHAILRELAATDPYAEYAADRSLRPEVPGPAEYIAALSAEGCTVDAWETTYFHVLSGDNAVLEWVKGTGARPVLQSLPDGLRERFEAEYGARLAEAYPQREFGTVLPFRRIFAVAQKRPVAQEGQA